MQQHGTGALNIDACRVPTTDRWSATGKQSAPGSALTGSVDGSLNRSVSSTHESGRWPTNVVLTHLAGCGEDGCEIDCPVVELDQQSGSSKSTPYVWKPHHSQDRSVMNAAKDGSLRKPSDGGYMDSGGASRFFPVFRYQAKAPTSERPKVDGIAHPTCKPLALMRWLVRLVTPPAGTVVDPFAGSGTTLEAALLEGAHPIGIEREANYLPLIHHRIARATGADEAA